MSRRKPMEEALGAGNVAVVTGGGDGIGRAMARRLSEAGLRVVVVDVNQSAIDNTLGQLVGSGHVGHSADVRDRAQLVSLADDVSSDVGDVRVLCNNAGIVIDS